MDNGPRYLNNFRGKYRKKRTLISEFTFIAINLCRWKPKVKKGQYT
jgi:hypothetical protein